jgi:hypothetical protein
MAELSGRKSLPSPETSSAIREQSSSLSASESTKTDPHSRWLSFLIPSTSDLIFVLLLAGFAAGPLAQKLLGDAGIGWHIRTGQLILKTGAVPRVDPFSATMRGQPWFAWEWLYDVLVGWLERIAGLNGVVFASALVIAGTYTLAFRRMVARGAGLIVAVALLLFSVLASSIHFLARPHVVSWLLTVVWFEILREFEAEGHVWRLAWLPGIMLVWVNLHGGFLVGLVLLALYFMAAVFEAALSGDGGARAGALRRTKALAAVGVTCALVTFANPYGYRLHDHIYRYLTDRFLMDHIDEFLSPNFHGVAQKFFALIILLTIATAATAHKKIRLSELLVIAFAVYSGLYAARNIPVASLLLVLVIGPYLGEASRSVPSEAKLSAIGRKWLDTFGDFEKRMGRLEAGVHGHWLPVAAILLGVWVCLHGGRLGMTQIMNATFDAKRFPVQAVEWLEHQGVSGPVFCPDAWGGYLIYSAFPRIQTVVDDRHDLYGSEYLKQYLKLIRVEPGWDQALAATGSSWVLLSNQSAAATLLRQVPAWEVDYSDETAVVFQRATK